MSRHVLCEESSPEEVESASILEEPDKEILQSRMSNPVISSCKDYISICRAWIRLQNDIFT